MLEQKGILL